MITFWQHTEMSWPHPIVWFPVVIQFYIKWSMSTCFGLFIPPLFSFAGKHGFVQKLIMQITEKAQLSTHFYNKTKTRKTFRHFFVYVVWKVDERWSRMMMIRSLDVLYHGCVFIRGQKNRLAVLHCESCWSALFGSVLWIVKVGRQGFCCLLCRKMTVKFADSTLKTNTNCCKYTQ